MDGRLTRRAWLGATAATALAAPAMAQGAEGPPAEFRVMAPGVHDYGSALKALAAYARREITELGLPGMCLSVTDAEGFTAVLSVGVADLETREPIRPDHLFQIGSISKSFLSLTILSLADSGAIDLDAPMARYLPEAALPSEPVTVRQLLSHTGGLPDDARLFPRVPEGRLWTGFTPGSRFSYSNTGYVLLGAMVERVTGLSHEAVIVARVRARLGVADIAGDITEANRARFPKGYRPADQSQAAELPGAAMAEAKWDSETTAAGGIAATSEMMARYLRGLLNLGAGRGAPVLTDASARQFTVPVAGAEEFGRGAHYALGVALQPVDGVACLHHTGGMVAFSSSFHVDPSAGVAAFASVNARQGGYRPRQTTAYAIRLMRAARAAATPPAAPDPWALSRINDPAPLFGTFAAADGRVFTIAAGEGFPRFAAVGDSEPLYRAGESLATPHPLYARHSLDPVIVDGRASAFWWGEALFGRDAPPAQPAAPERLRALAGVYLNRDPWIGSATVLARGDGLVFDGGARLINRGDWWSLDKDIGGVERFRFDGMLNGRATRLNVSGIDLLRL
jgi:CubicO group peptidase (beta-lactamase class C family)